MNSWRVLSAGLSRSDGMEIGCQTRPGIQSISTAPIPYRYRAAQSLLSMQISHLHIISGIRAITHPEFLQEMPPTRVLRVCLTQCFLVVSQGRLENYGLGKNLNDELYTNKRLSFSQASWALYAPPRTYGVSVQYNYTSCGII